MKFIASPVVPISTCLGWLELGKRFYQNTMGLPQHEEKTVYNDILNKYKYGAQQNTQTKLLACEPNGVSGHLSAMWVELLVVLLISMCISSAVSLIESAMPVGAFSIVLPH